MRSTLFGVYGSCKTGALLGDLDKRVESIAAIYCTTLNAVVRGRSASRNSCRAEFLADVGSRISDWRIHCVRIVRVPAQAQIGGLNGSVRLP